MIIGNYMGCIGKIESELCLACLTGKYPLKFADKITELEEAILIGIKDNPPISLPESNCIDDSWKVNEEMSKVLNEDELKNIKYKGGRR